MDSLSFVFGWSKAIGFQAKTIHQFQVENLKRFALVNLVKRKELQILNR
jgi:hypothetical protein